MEKKDLKVITVPCYSCYLSQQLSHLPIMSSGLPKPPCKPSLCSLLSSCVSPSLPQVAPTPRKSMKGGEVVASKWPFSPFSLNDDDDDDSAAETPDAAE